MNRQNDYIGVSQCGDGTWQYSVRKASGKLKTEGGFSTAKVAALLRDEYIIRHQLDEERSFTVKRMAKMRNEAYEQMFGRQD
ncbi:hypothetical protein [Candidatus Electronema sp. JC]|uniref:hypothetical protein n=1 Tax=Candidatus Electronema sp. JC TaxID=3401570 RepID=UPI003AA98B14